MAISQNPSLPRRAFLRGQFFESLKTEKTPQDVHVIRPPWADLSCFSQGCIACNRCIEVCESKILRIGNDGLPEVDFNQGECTFCKQCVEICSQPIFYPTSQLPWTHKVNINQHCLLNQRVECRSCGDSCESRAIRFKARLGGIAELTLDINQCNGCGACLRLCPTQAINVAIQPTSTNITNELRKE